MSTITVRETPGILSIRLSAPLPRTHEDWDPVASAVHHACLGRAASDGLVIELDGVRRLTSAEIAGIVRCLVCAMRSAQLPCRMRLVSDSEMVRRAFRICSSDDLGACASYDQAIAELCRLN